MRAAYARVVLWSLVLLGIVCTTATAQQAARPVSEEVVHEVAAKLRCVVCQNLSVADSPSEMAKQMREIVRERLAAGDRPDEVVQFFVERYGEWVLLSPRPSGFNLLVWLFPVAAVAVGLVSVAVVLRRSTRPRRRAGGAPATVDAAMSERIRRELERGR